MTVQNDGKPISDWLKPRRENSRDYPASGTAGSRAVDYPFPNVNLTFRLRFSISRLAQQ